MRAEFSETPTKVTIQCPVTIIQHAGRGNYPTKMCTHIQKLNSNAPPAPSLLLSLRRYIWRHSPYCPESSKHGVVVRENGRWVHKKSRGD